jgi:hypothetical protein
VYTGVEPVVYDNPEKWGGRHVRANSLIEISHDDPSWPTECAQGCDYVFQDEDQWQRWSELLYRRADNGELRVLHQNAPAPNAPSAEPGATWNASWLPFSKGPDGMTLMVRCPDGHDWTVDSRASNCTMPEDNEHRCWVRHGDPRECHVTVDKNGLTCAAGAGSIDTGSWHGFLQNGVLTP